MKVEEVVERDCCQPQDFKPYRGVASKDGVKYKFCVHCGEIYRETHSLDPVGNREFGWDIVRFWQCR